MSGSRYLSGQSAGSTVPSKGQIPPRVISTAKVGIPRICGFEVSSSAGGVVALIAAEATKAESDEEVEEVEEAEEAPTGAAWGTETVELVGMTEVVEEAEAM